ncbi:MAG: hypothetical protein KatS3mg050_4514 [Litorilinea sp.]|nr:MAG: hypothetical protein KatS3mg050_4514 [Litorilinea sp.]
MHPLTSRFGRWPASLFLALILVAGFTLRTWNVNFDQGIGAHPDERSTTCTYAPAMHLPQSWDEFWDPRRSPLNPLWDPVQQQVRKFTYGHFPLYLGVAMGHLLHELAPVAARLPVPQEKVDLMLRANQPCGGVAVAGRLTIALLDTWTIFLLYLLGRRLFSTGTGLLAAAFYAFTAQAIQLSHFFAMDPASTTFTVLAVLGGVAAIQERTWRAMVLTGVAAGLAIASKFSALPVLLVPVVAGLLQLWEPFQAQAAPRVAEGWGRAQFRALLGIPLALAVAGLTFFVTSPYAVLDWRNFIQATLVEQGQMVRGLADFPFTRQYRNTTPYIYFIRQQVQWGMGWPLGLLALAGTLYFLAGFFRSLYRMASAWLGSRLHPRHGQSLPTGRTLSTQEMGLLVVWSWVLPYFGLTGAFLAKFNRYMSPVLPFMLLFGAGLVYVLGHRWPVDRAQDAASRPGAARLGRMAAALLAGIGLVGGLFWSLAYVNGVYNHEHTWITASRWIYQNVPRGSVILWEQWDDPLPKTIPGEPGMDMASTGLRNIDWGPYEEDTAEKYAILKQKLREADYVVYSSKRIYDSVDELPERYPMTNLYYQAMWDGRLGFELALDLTSPPRLFGLVFEDRHADESWSLYDHPQVTIFRKVRNLSDAEFDAIFDHVWETAIPYYRGADSPLSPFLNLLGLGASPESANQGLVPRVLALLMGGETGATAPMPAARPSLMLPQPLSTLPVVDNYRWNRLASEEQVLGPWLAVAFWWAVLALLGWLAWPLAFYLFAPFRDRGYLFSRTLGWLLPAWFLWLLASHGLVYNTVRAAWGSVLLLGLVGGAAAWNQRQALARFVRERWPLLLLGEGLFAGAYLFFVLIRMANPDLWQPWFGGEKFMEFAFLNGILRSPTFPPVDPHFAGGYINYYYFGLYLAAYLIKLTGIYAEVAFNLVIPTLFALTVVNAFAVAYSAWGFARGGRPPASLRWQEGAAASLLAPLFIALLGNLDGFAQVLRRLADGSPVHFQSAFPGLETLVGALVGLVGVLRGTHSLGSYDFWAPSRVIPFTINEFPYWSFLFADLHPHLIGIPFAVLFLGLILLLLRLPELPLWRPAYGVRLLALFALMLGTLASVNLWELPTYLLLGVLALAVSQYRVWGRIRWGLTGALAVFYLAGAYLSFRPFFAHYVNVGASGIGLVRAGDDLGTWLLIWGFLGFVVVSWLFWRLCQPPAAPGLGLERLLGMVCRRYDRLPRLVYLHRLLVTRPTLGYLLGVNLLPATLVATVLALAWGRTVLALCLALLGPAFLLLWQRARCRVGRGLQVPAVGQVAPRPGDLPAWGSAADAFVALLTVVGLAILAGTQVVYLKDFLQGGDWYRMNTLFKFFNQVWVLWGMAAAVAVPWLWRRNLPSWPARLVPLPFWWRGVFGLLLAASLTFLVLGTPARLAQRMVGWRPPFGTLNGMAYMQQGTYTWPDENHVIELRHDWDAIRWLLAHVRGNLVIVESSEVDYYRAGGTRVASMTGLSGLRGMHESEQRFGEALGYRDGLHREFWQTSDLARLQAIIDELEIALIYVGPLERQQHPDAPARLEALAGQGRLQVLYQNEGVTIYAVPGALARTDRGVYVPVPRGG